MKTVLTIAGSDSSGGAGIQADLKTMLANGVYGMSAITALTAQNTTGVSAIMEVAPEFLEKQLDAVFTDIRPDAVKIGMVSSAADQGDRRAPELLSGGTYCSRSGDGSHQRSQTHRRRCGGDAERAAAASGSFGDAQYTGGRGAFRL